jgi:hypothetical protein
MVASGKDIWDKSDEFHFLYQCLAGDSSIVARIDNLVADHEWAKAGVMIRGSLSKQSKNAMLYLSGDNGLRWQYRQDYKGTSTSAVVDAAGTAPKYLKLTRTGLTVEAFVSDDGLTFTPAGSVTFGALNDPVYIGLALTSHDDGNLATADFSEVSLTGGTAPESDWPIGDEVYPIGTKTFGTRLTRIEDRNGYGLDITYQSFTPAEIAESPERQWIRDSISRLAGVG